MTLKKSTAKKSTVKTEKPSVNPEEISKINKEPNKLSTPASLGYRMPAEWEPQDAIWLSWPHNLETFGPGLEEVRQIFVDFIAALHVGQKINLLVNNAEQKQDALKRFQVANINSKQIQFYDIANVDVWFRDYGPTFIINDENPKAPLAMTKWIFNAWGDKYDDLKRDNQIPYEMNQTMKVPMFEAGIVLEGGSIDVNGQGSILTTEQCLLNKNRNPQLSCGQIEEYLTQYLDVTNIIWLKEGIAGDDTDGHVDDIARFVAPDTVLCAIEDDPHDENFKPLQENYKLLQQAVTESGEPLKVIKLPMPGPVILEGRRYPASYANFYIGNSAVVVPVFAQENDQKALDIIQSVFPNRRVVGINCTQLVYGYGTLHCSSQQQPHA